MIVTGLAADLLRRACQSVQPVRTDIMPADERNDHAAIDLICATCDYLIVTLQDVPPARQ